MKGITTIAALPGSGAGCVSALPAEVGAIERDADMIDVIAEPPEPTNLTVADRLGFEPFDYCERN